MNGEASIRTKGAAIARPAATATQSSAKVALLRQNIVPTPRGLGGPNRRICTLLTIAAVIAAILVAVSSFSANKLQAAPGAGTLFGTDPGGGGNLIMVNTGTGAGALVANLVSTQFHLSRSIPRPASCMRGPAKVILASLQLLPPE